MLLIILFSIYKSKSKYKILKLTHRSTQQVYKVTKFIKFTLLVYYSPLNSIRYIYSITTIKRDLRFQHVNFNNT